jgi:hypothetical protein
MDYLLLPLDGDNIVTPKYPILDHPDIITRALMAIGIGCDVYLGGISTITPKKIYDEIQKSHKKTKIYQHMTY